jgi:hemolysin activation/secretion protein
MLWPAAGVARGLRVLVVASVVIAWERLGFETGRASRWQADLRGYLGIGGSTVLALRGQLVRSNAALPGAEQQLLGGSGSLRGYRTGHRAGDNLAAGTLELRQPLGSPLSVRRVGLKAFVDVGTAWSAGGRLGGQRFEHGIGGGVYAGAGPFVIDLDVAWPEQGRPRAHGGVKVAF